nr:tetratricopeptide repeat protein [Lentibacillus sediminis]
MDTIMQAVKLMESSQSEKALELLENYLPKAEEEERYTIAELYMQWGMLQEASEVFRELLERYPGESEIKVKLADIYIEMEADEQAINLLNEIGEDDPAFVQALIQLADLYQAQGLFEVAEQKLLLAKQQEPNEPIIDFALGELLFSIGEYLRAITYYERLLGKTQEVANISIHDRLAEAHAASGQYEEALEFYQQTESENPDTLFRYGFTAKQAGRHDIAIKAWEQVIELDAYYHSVYYQLAEVYDEEKMPKEAYETAEKGLEIDEFNKELYFLAGSLAHQLGRDERSEKLVREALALDPDYKEAVLFLIELFKTAENFSAIADLLTEIKNTGAEDPLYEWELAKAYNEMESYDLALNHYNEAYNGLKDDSDFMKEYGYFLLEEGRPREALRIFEAYLKQQPEDTETEEFLTRLRQENEA